jgi:hypothetical protein
MKPGFWCLKAGNRFMVPRYRYDLQRDKSTSWNVFGMKRLAKFKQAVGYTSTKTKDILVKFAEQIYSPDRSLKPDGLQYRP